MCGISCFMQSHTPRRLTAIIRSKESSDHSCVFLPLASTWNPAMPALLNAQSIRPYAATTERIISCTVAHVAGHRHGLAAGGIDQRDGLLSAFDVGVGYRYAGTLARKDQRRRAS